MSQPDTARTDLASGNWQAIVATDVVDSTLLSTRPQRSEDFWLGHDRAARDLIRRCGGREIGRTDGVVALFDSAAQALRFAHDYHAALAHLPTPLLARIGVHGGPLRLRANADADIAQGAVPFEVDGPVLPVAMRLQALALGGQTLVSRALLNAAGDPPACAHGRWQLKGVAEPLEVAEPLYEGTQPRRPPDADKAYQVERVEGSWRPVAVGRARLPQARGVFVGRAALLAEIERRLDREGTLLTLLGPGGVGKTRLALQFVRHGIHCFEGGVWFCELSEAADADRVLQALARGLGVPLTAGDGPQILAQVLAARGRCLLLLDNAETAAAVLPALLERWQHEASAMRVLCTSRVALGLAAETVLPVPPLEEEEACALFARRADDAGSVLGAADRLALPALVQALDRLPLALELAAARVAALAPAQQLARMDRWRQWLGGSRGAAHPARHGTLAAVFRASWELLDATERSVLAQLTVFDGGFDLAAAEAVVDAGAAWIGELLAALIAKSLLQQPAGARYALLRTVRDEAAALAAESVPGWSGAPDERADGLQRRRALHYCGLDERLVLDGGFADLDNLTGACAWASASGAGALAVSALTLCAEVMLVRGPVRRLLALAEAVAAMPALAIGDRAEAGRILGNALRALGRHTEGMQRYEQALALAHEAGDRLRSVRLACAIAVPWARAGRQAQALTLLAQAGRDAAALDDAVRLCAVRNTQGAVAMAGADLGLAIDHFTQALALAEQAQHRRWEGGVRGNLGSALHLSGRTGEARHHYERALEIAREVGDRAWAASAQCNLGLLLLETGQREPARAALEQALHGARDIGFALLEATAGCNLGLLLNDDQPALAVGPLQDAALLATRLAEHALAAQCERALGDALAASGEQPAALAAARRGLVHAQTSANGAEIVRSQLQLARLHATAADSSAARQALAAARQACSALGAAADAELWRQIEAQASAAAPTSAAP